jgi:hypothetical protein
VPALAQILKLVEDNHELRRNRMLFGDRAETTRLAARLEDRVATPEARSSSVGGTRLPPGPWLGYGERRRSAPSGQRVSVVRAHDGW